MYIIYIYIYIYMYSFIFDPHTKKMTSIYSNKAKIIIQSYINHLRGGVYAQIII